MADDSLQKITDKPDRRIERCRYAPEGAEHAGNYFHTNKTRRFNYEESRPHNSKQLLLHGKAATGIGTSSM